jgi:hypothetical protein
MPDYRPVWQQVWEQNLLAARRGDLEAHRRLEEAGRQLPTGTAYRTFKGVTCPWCGGSMVRSRKDCCPVAKG